MYPYFSTRKQIPRPLYAKELSDNNNILNESASKLSDIILLSMENETKDHAFYEKLLPLLKEEDRSIVNSIMLDETKHYKLLSHIYKLLNNKSPDHKTIKEAEVSGNISKDLSEALLDEAEAVKLYRELMSSAVTEEIKDLFFEIMTDEMMHSTLLNYLYTKYR